MDKTFETCWQNFYKERIYPVMQILIDIDDVYSFINSQLVEYNAIFVPGSETPADPFGKLEFKTKEDATLFKLKWS